MTETLTPPSPETSYGLEPLEASNNYSNGVYANGLVANTAADSPGESLGISADGVPNQADIDKASPSEVAPPEIDQLFGRPTREQVRDRFKIPENLSESESMAMLRFASYEVRDAFSAHIKLIDHVDGYAFFGLQIRHEEGSQDGEIKQRTRFEGTTSFSFNELVVDPDRFENEAKVLERRMSFEWKNPEDARLLTMLDNYTHEYAHLLGVGASGVLKIGNSRSRELHAAVLASNPDMGLTGISDSDPQINDERFANGIARTVLKGYMKELGYNDSNADEFFVAVNGLEKEWEAEGISHFDAVEHARSTNQSVGKAALELAGVEDHASLGYEGELGYHSPFSKEDIVRILDQLDTWARGEKPNGTIDPEVYRNSFDAYYPNGHPEISKRR